MLPLTQVPGSLRIPSFLCFGVGSSSSLVDSTTAARFLERFLVLVPELTPDLAAKIAPDLVRALAPEPAGATPEADNDRRGRGDESRNAEGQPARQRHAEGQHQRQRKAEKRIVTLAHKTSRTPAMQQQRQ